MPSHVQVLAPPVFDVGVSGSGYALVRHAMHTLSANSYVDMPHV